MKSEKLQFKIQNFFSTFFILLIFVFSGCSSSREFSNENPELIKDIVFVDDGMTFNIETRANTVSEFLKEQNIDIKDQDLIFPSLDSRLFYNTKIRLDRAKNIVITDGQEERNVVTQSKDVEGVLAENSIKLGEDDLISPKIWSPIRDEEEIEIIRVEIKEEKIIKAIDFKEITEEDETLGWRVKKIKQKGIEGKEEIVYRVVTHNGKEISRKILDRNTIENPTPEISVQGTYMKLGKASTGAATWYSYTGTMAAANPWLPLGSYVKVTNTANGKSVVVKINDRGPFGDGRILDLDKVAFQKIADLGAGVINVKMEPILN